MSRIISFSADREFAESFETLIEKSGYTNRSRFLRDASMYFAEIQQRGDLMNMDDNQVVEGHIIVHYQERTEQRLMVSRTDSIEVARIITVAGLVIPATRVLMWFMSRGLLSMSGLCMGNCRILRT